MIAIDRELDVFGVIILGCVTACGGGILRDMILGQTPPMSFINPVYLTTAAVSAIVVFVYTKYRHKRITDKHQVGKLQLDFDMPLNIIDAAGLGIFSVIGLGLTQWLTVAGLVVAPVVICEAAKLLGR